MGICHLNLFHQSYNLSWFYTFISIKYLYNLIESFLNFLFTGSLNCTFVTGWLGCVFCVTKNYFDMNESINFRHQVFNHLFYLRVNDYSRPNKNCTILLPKSQFSQKTFGLSSSSNKYRDRLDYRTCLKHWRIYTFNHKYRIIIST